MKPDRITVAVGCIVALLAALVATDHAGGWNDGSRLATVEALVDHGTWAIDESIFMRSAAPFGPDCQETCRRGTLDKMFIDGHYYSDKSPVPALPLAGTYWLWRHLGGPSFAERPNLVCWWLIFASSGLAYVIAVLAVDALARRRLDARMRILVVASFALSTVALPYARAVNNHILLLAATAVLMALIDAGETPTLGQLATIGFTAGLAYTIDLGAGPIICFGAGCWALARARTGAIVVALAAVPCVVLHHALNYHIGGSWKPANAVAEYFNWPGCPFNAANMTGGWRHKHVGAFLLYAADMLAGRRGFLNYNLPLWLAFAGWFALVRRPRDRAELLLAGFWCVGVWLTYAATSTNLSGECCSVRWFVPLLAPGYYVLTRLLAERPEFRADALVLSIAGACLCVGMTANGPWSGRMPVGFWPIVAVAGLGGWRVARRRSADTIAPPDQGASAWPRTSRSSAA